MKLQGLKKQASKLYKAIDWKKIDEDTKRVVITERSGNNYEDLLKITFKVSEDTNLSTDSVYEFTMEALGVIADASGDTIDEIREAGYEIEADAYTSSLIEWLNQSNYHVYYLDEAIKNGATDGFNALYQAQQEAKQEVFNIVLDWMTDYYNIKDGNYPLTTGK